MGEGSIVNIGSPQIYTNGAYCSPCKITVNGREIWAWIVEEFVDDSYCDGEMVLPIEHSYNKDDLLKPFENEDDASEKD